MDLAVSSSTSSPTLPNDESSQGEVNQLMSCKVCGNEIPPFKSQQSQSGSVCCHSCMAFSKRSQQTTRESNFEHRALESDKNGLVDVVDRTKYQMNPDNAYLENGMEDPGLDLTNTHIKERVNNPNKRRRVSEDTGKEGSGSSCSVVPPQPRLLPIPTESDYYNLNYPGESYCEGPSSPNTGSLSELNAVQRKRSLDIFNDEEEEEYLEARKKKKQESKISSYDIKRINEILQCFSMASTQEDSKLSKSLISKFVNMHCRIGTVEEATFIDYITYLVTTFTTFAKCQPLFKGLSNTDQLALLFKNTSLYIQYILARYFSAETGEEQLEWILGLQVPVEMITENKRLAKVEASDWGGTLSFAHDPVMMSTYLKIAQEVTNIRNCSNVYNGILANMILYHQGKGVELEESRRIGNIYEEACFFTNKGTFSKVSESDNDKFFRLLDTMNDIFSNTSFNMGLNVEETADQTRRSLVPIPGGDTQDSIVHVPLGFTLEDKMFLHQQYGMFQRSYSSIPVSKLILKLYYDSTMYKKPAPVSLMPHAIKMFLERFRRVFFDLTQDYGIHPEDQKRLWSRNCAMAVAFNILKMETAESGNHQFNMALGRLENHAAIKSRYNMEFDFFNMADVCGGRLGKETLELYFTLVSKVKHLVIDGLSFMLITLITMLETPSGFNLVSGHHLKTQLQQKLIRLLKCHQESIGTNTIFHEAEFAKTMKYIIGLSQFIPKLCS